MFGRGLKTLTLLTLITLSVGWALVFFYAPIDADQGFIQKIFYLHVPLSIFALVGFIAGGVFAIQHLRTGRSEFDLKSYVAIHMSLIFGVAVLVTGSIWAKASWGKWWVWDEATLVSFLIVFLLYVTYMPLRFSIEDEDRRARVSSVFAITAGAFVPLNFLAVRLAESLVHPRVLSATGGSMPGSMRLTFLVCLVGIGLLYTTLWKMELTGKNVSKKIKRLGRVLEQEQRANSGEFTAPGSGIATSTSER